MRTKLFLILFLVLPLADLFYSCCDCETMTTNMHYSHQYLSVKNLDNSRERAVETSSLECNKNAYGMRIFLVRSTYNLAQNSVCSPLFTQSAMAMRCECPPDYIFLAADSIISIEVKTLNYFDSTHPEQSDITEYFRVGERSLQPVKEYVENRRYSFSSYSETLESHDKEISMDLFLMEAPQTTGTHQFLIRILLSDERILEQETDKINLI